MVVVFLFLYLQCITIIWEQSHLYNFIVNILLPKEGCSREAAQIVSQMIVMHLLTGVFVSGKYKFI
nr:MAG TPA: hypothetical protein [Caudoviricetes sp.]